MTFRKPPAQFSIERRRIMDAPGGSYDAATADRQGRRSAPATEARRPALKFVEASGGVEVRLGVVTVAVIAANPADRGRAEFIFRCFLPPAKASPDPAATLAVAKTAIRNRVADWLDAIGDRAGARAAREGRG